MTRELDEPAIWRRTAGEQKCMFGHTGRFCCYPATVHVMRNDGTTTMDCRTHAVWWNHHRYHDMHPIGGACGLPDTTWELSTSPRKPGRCTIEGLSDIPDLFAGDYGAPG